MMAKIVQGRGFKGVVNYVLDKEKATLLYADGIRLKNKNSVIQSFITQSKLNPKISKPVAHISLNFSAQDKDKMTDKFMVNMAQEYMKKMGYENTQYIITRHHDTDHPHIHLVINRIDNEGKRITDQNEKLRSTKVCMELTKKYSLYIASGKENVKGHRLKEPDKTKYEIYNALRTLVPKCKNWQQLKDELRKSDITSEFRNKGDTNEVQGIKFSKNGYIFNGSKVDRQFSYSKIDWQLNQNNKMQEATNHQQVQDHSHSQSPSAIETVGSALGGLFDIQPSSGYEENEADALRQQRKKKKGKSL
ncbi:MAG TPA: mobilization protein [Rikenellaceae bacterium]|nr:MAG: mobilization protein [Bacteroidetes bacterium GWE2_40_15]HBZ25378.1 mobilization protein [Rikenellaceae bacterium]